MPVCSPVPAVDIPPVDVTTLLFGRGADLPAGREDAPLLVDGHTGDSLTLSALKQMAESVAAALAARGFSLDAGSVASDGRGRVAAVYSPPDIRFSAVHFGTLAAGGTYTAIDPALDTEQAAARLKEGGVSVVFAAPDLVPRLLDAMAAAGADIPASNIILLRGSSLLHPSIDALDRVPPGTMLGALAGAGPALAERVALISYSSGTTGPPKGAMLTHRNIVAMWAVVGSYSPRRTGAAAPPAGKQKRTLSALGPWHIYGHCTLCYQPFGAGDCVVQLREFDVAGYLAAIERYRIDHLNATPRYLLELFAGSRACGAGRVATKTQPAREFDIGSVRSLVCGGAPLGPHLRARYSDYFGGVPIFSGYGQVETSSAIGGVSWRRPAPGAVGVLYPNSTAKVVDRDGRETTGYGELCVAGPHVMRGYVGRPAAEHTDGDGFIRTGDCARLDGDGNIFLRGRVADVIHAAGGPLYPTEIEGVLDEHPAVGDVAVVGSGPDGHAQPVAFVAVVPSQDADADADADARLRDVERWARERLGIPVRCRAIAAIPRTPAGKKLRHQLRALLDAAP
ncbi:4-coumarate--CoA ligase [Coemansia javaensis]|uniref:4-coumarate--CoA ligase n=1 Tax=Coemansia javaensis TaxID=2761396 RepID=A0A9W8HFU1_9FUNG|nr:4-coumarate--CoA ligase [Coemansia javaensis]